MAEVMEDEVRVVNHDARDRESLTWCGRFGAGVPVAARLDEVGPAARVCVPPEGPQTIPYPK